MVVRIKATLADGRSFEGPIQGSGGKLGSGALHAGYVHAVNEAMKRLAGATRLAARGRSTGIFEPESGCVAIYPEFSAESDGERVIVPLKDTVFEALYDQSDEDDD